ncbi:nucleotide pyrophosphohydrolase [Effusibacillus pohliae]|uniref:nucleotide pyrophosphohydrolase n=1 Tax=Effusibacillus pohliae TaxID=232270 RepID=UPI0003817830|nr:nucleotide pyrophosphohydrolase [Effusibacillus pohliae]
MEKLTLSAMQQEVDEYISQFKEGYFPPMSLIVRLTEELGELAREVSHRFGEKKKKATEANGSIAEEIGDVLYCLTCLANSLDIDLEQAHRAVMHKFRTRDADRWTRKDD